MKRVRRSCKVPRVPVGGVHTLMMATASLFGGKNLCPSSLLKKPYTLKSYHSRMLQCTCAVD
jgi:hypothetical protein